MQLLFFGCYNVIITRLCYELYYHNPHSLTTNLKGKGLTLAATRSSSFLSPLGPMLRVNLAFDVYRTDELNSNWECSSSCSYRIIQLQSKPKHTETKRSQDASLYVKHGPMQNAISFLIKSILAKNADSIWMSSFSLRRVSVFKLGFKCVDTKHLCAERVPSTINSIYK